MMISLYCQKKIKYKQALFGKIEGKWDKMELHVDEKKADFMPF